MKHFWKINIYEIQIILFWILGVLILHLGDWKWVGWLSIGYGWFTFLYIFGYTIKYHREIIDEFNDPHPTDMEGE